MQLLKTENFKHSSLAPLKDLRVDQKIKVLIVYDGSENAEIALDDLKRAGLPRGAEALALVTDVCLPSSPEDINRAVADRRMMVLKSGVSSFVPALRNVEEQRVMSQKIERRLRSMFPVGVKLEALPERNSIRRGTVRKAEAWGADLIVIGSKESPSPHITDYCGAAVEIAAQSHCSARIARPSNGVAGAPVRIVIGVDGSPNANNCFRAAAQRSWPKGSQACVVVVPKPGPRIDMFPATVASTLDGKRRTLAARMIEQGIEDLGAAGLKVSVATREHLPLDVLIEETREWGANCLFVDALGFRRTESNKGATSVSNVVKALAMGAPCSVEIVRGKSLSEEFLSPAA